MMSASILFWLLLPLPGYALVRRIALDELDSGLMGTLAVSFLFTLGALSPAAILCYVIELPVWFLSAYLVLIFVIGIISISAQRAWEATGKLFLTACGVELCIVVIDMAIGARIGTFIAGDAFVHLSRIRLILEQGFNNRDPFVASPYFFPVYHTNLLHALYAVCTQITRCDLFDVWFDSLPFGKFLVAAGSYYLTWCVFRRRSVAWVGAMFVVGVRGPFQYIVYPNQLCPYFLTPVLIGCLVAAVREPCGWSQVVKVAIASLVIGQFHGLYVLFALMAAGPMLGVVILQRLVQRRPDRWKLLACAAAMWVGFPFILVSKWQTPVVNRAPESDTAVVGDSGYFVHVGSKNVMRNPADLVHTLGGGVGNSVAWIAGIACSIACSRRKETGFLLGIIATSLLIFYVPQICSFFLVRLGEEWVMQRFDFVFGVCQIALVPGAIASIIGTTRLPAIGWAILSVVSVFAGAASAGHQAPDNWDSILKIAQLPEDARKSVMAKLAEIRKFVTEVVPPGETILTDPGIGIGLVATTGSRLIIAERACNGVPDQYQRKADLAVMLAPDTPWEIRRSLMQKYGVRYFYPTTPPFDWAMQHSLQHWTVGRRTVFRINTD